MTIEQAKKFYQKETIKALGEGRTEDAKDCKQMELWLEELEKLRAKPSFTHGKWEDKHHVIPLDNVTLTGIYPTCSLCGYIGLGMGKRSNFCANCGADMRDDSALSN